MITYEPISMQQKTLSISNVNNTEKNYTDFLLEAELFYTFSKWFNLILTTILTIFGIFGNLISTKIFFGKHYKSIPIKPYLIMLSLSDLFVLITHYIDFSLRAWVNLFGIYSSKFNFVDKCWSCCKLVSYSRNVFRTMSVYALLLMTFQRFIILYFPLIRAKWCSIKFNKRLIIIICIIAILFNFPSLFIVDLVKHSGNGETFCNVKDDYLYFQFYIELLFVIFTILIPIIIIIILSVVLLYKIKSSISLCRFSICICNDIKLKESAKKTNLNLSYFGKLNSSSLNSDSLKNDGLINKDNFKELRFKSVSLKIYFNDKKGCHLKSSNTINTIMPKPKISILKTVKKVKSHSLAYNTSILKCNNLNSIKLDCASNQTLQNKQTNQRNGKDLDLKKKNGGHSIRTTYVLVLISKWFVLLHLPYFICWVIFRISMSQQYELFKTIQNEQYSNYSSNDTLNDTFSSSEIIYSDYTNEIITKTKIKTNLIRGFLNIFEVLFLLNYSIHFLLYIVNGPLFRKRFCKKMLNFLRRFK